MSGSFSTPTLAYIQKEVKRNNSKPNSIFSTSNISRTLGLFSLKTEDERLKKIKEYEENEWDREEV